MVQLLDMSSHLSEFSKPSVDCKLKMLKPRSPRHPFEPLPESIAVTGRVLAQAGSGPLTRAQVLRAMGFDRDHGAATRVLAASIQYGLLERVGAKFRISQRMLRIVDPAASDNRRSLALMGALRGPRAFRRIVDELGLEASLDAIEEFLLGLGFTKSGAERAARNFRQTVRYVGASRVAPKGPPSERKHKAGSILHATIEMEFAASSITVTATFSS